MAENTTRPSPVEARLRKSPLAVTCDLMDEQQHVTPMRLHSIHIHGAKQEVTAELKKQGYSPLGRWEPSNADATYSARVFALNDVS